MNCKLMAKFSLKQIVFTLLFVVLVSACGDSSNDPSGNKRFDFNLRGVWMSNDASIYFGELVIDYNRITIRGYEEIQTLPHSDDAKRPFREFTKGTPLSGYVEGGIMFIRDAGEWHEIPYVYYTENFGNDRFLRFTFGGRTEILSRITD